MEIISIEYGGTNITIEVIRKQVKNISLRVSPNSKVTVTANPLINTDILNDFVTKKSYWIFKQLSKFKNMHYESNEKEFVSGENIRYLGKQYRLKIIPSVENNVKWVRGYIHIYTKKPENKDLKQKLFEKWRHMRVEKIFNEIFTSSFSKLERFSLEKPKLKFRKMKSRWGSYIPKNNTITLNTELIKAPKLCIEYVLIHELVHLVYPNHSKAFYNLLSVQLPDWKQRKQILDEEFGMIIN